MKPRNNYGFGRCGLTAQCFSPFYSGESAYASTAQNPAARATSGPFAEALSRNPVPAHPIACSDGLAVQRRLLGRRDCPDHSQKRRCSSLLAPSLSTGRLFRSHRSSALWATADDHGRDRSVPPRLHSAVARAFKLKRPGWTTALLAKLVRRIFKVRVTDECIRQHLERIEAVCRRPTWTVKHLAEQQPGYAQKKGP